MNQNDTRELQRRKLPSGVRVKLDNGSTIVVPLEELASSYDVNSPIVRSVEVGTAHVTQDSVLRWDCPTVLGFNIMSCAEPSTFIAIANGIVVGRVDVEGLARTAATADVQG